MASLGLGLSVAKACAHCGICKYTFYDWLKRGEAGEEPYATFLAAAAETRGKAEAKYLKRLDELSEQDDDAPTAFRATAWALERLFDHRKPKDSEEVVESETVEPTSVAIVYEGTASADPQD